jgi:DNA-binding NtrC family response regulator
MPRDIVLCVDDEPIVLRACSTAVASAGFRPVVAENGVGALEVFEKMADEICLVLADIIMPGCGGIELAERILEIDPKMKILLMSGYGDTVIDRLIVHNFPIIRKPFIHSVLIEKIRSVLGNERRCDPAT